MSLDEAIDESSIALGLTQRIPTQVSHIFLNLASNEKVYVSLKSNFYFHKKITSQKI